MKTFNLIGLAIVFLFLFTTNRICGQATIASNAIGANRYLGFSGAQDLEFRTNNATRMTLTQTNGWLGLGIAAPASLLHLNTTATGNLFRTDGSEYNTNEWSLYTGSGSILQRYRLFVEPSTSGTPYMVNQQANYSHMQFITADGASGANLHSRMRINGYSPTNTIQSFTNQNTSGFVAITADNNYWSDALSPKTPVSLLHLVGDYNGSIPFSYRPWMRNGVSFTLGADMSFVGPRLVNDQSDIFEMVMAWGDNPEGEFGPDVMSFRSMAGDGQGSTGADDLAGSDIDGREVMRMGGNGNVGIGPRFNNQYMPQSTLHQHQENAASSWFQISNQFLASGASSNAGPTTVANTDGMRLGIVGTTVSLANGTALLYNQEDRPLLLSNNANTNTINLVTGATSERVRVTSVGTPTNLTTGLVGTYNPGSLGTTLTRVAISHDPGAPATRPLSLMHLGYNINATTGTNGWRNWMDIGTFTTNGTDHVYLGLKHEGATNRQDAVLSWGDDQAANGPDNLRFIFTSQTAGGGTTPATGTNGLEGMRLTPTTTTGVRVGIGGSPTDNAYTGGTSAGNTLEVNAWGNNTTTPGGSSGLRFTNLNTTSPTLENPGEGILTVDANGDVIYVEDGGGGDDCRWVDFTYGIGTGFASTPCQEQNVGVGDFPDFKAKLYSFAADLTITDAVKGFNMYQTSNHYGGNFYGWGAGVYTDAGASGAPGIISGGGGVAMGGSWSVVSDATLKENIQSIENASEILNNLNPTNYTFRTEEYPQLNLEQGTHYGVIAQELEEILPNLIREAHYPTQYDSLGNLVSEALNFKAVNYDELIPILIAGFKEQQTQINSLQQQINGCCSAHGEVTPEAPGMPTGNPEHQQSITLTNADKAMLGFASPNPNKGEVYVDYYIPTGHNGTAEMLFTDATGRPVQNVLITGKGNGRLNIDTATLAAGQYQYTLIVDGEIIATRKMIRE